MHLKTANTGLCALFAFVAGCNIAPSSHLNGGEECFDGQAIGGTLTAEETPATDDNISRINETRSSEATTTADSSLETLSFSPAATNKGPTQASLSISLQNPNDLLAKSMRSKLESLLGLFKLDDYIFKRNILITNTPSFSGGLGPDPLELSTYLEDKGDALLLTFLHEQSHLAYPHSDAAWDNLLLALRSEFRSVPAKTPAEIGRGEDARYLHVAVNWLELQAGKRFIGIDRTVAAMCASEIYPNIYALVLENENRIGELMKQFKLNIEPFTPTPLPRSCQTRS